MKSSIMVHGNGGTLTTNLKAHICNYSDVWFHKGAITNILSLKNVFCCFHVTYNSNDSNMFAIKKPDGTILHFVMHDDGLHYHNTKN